VVYAPQTSNVDVGIDHISFAVADVASSAAEFVDRYGFRVVATGAEPDRFATVAVRQRDIVLVLTQGISDDHPATVFTVRHGDGVSGIALRGADPGFTGRTLTAFGDVTHTFVARAKDEPWSLPGLVAVPAEPAQRLQPAQRQELLSVDHIAVCLENGQLEPTVEFYRRTLGWRQIFEENIHVGTQAMQSKVVQSPNRQVTLTLLQPMTGTEPGQIDDFLKNHGGGGVQHLAFAVPDIVRAVAALGAAGVRFLHTPDAYYQGLGQRLGLTTHPAERLREFDILADRDHDGELFQIFTRSEHPRRTLFMEIIERQGARTFGTNNIRKLYEAVERQDRA
jgi:4-hydroxymandelate synthase